MRTHAEFEAREMVHVIKHRTIDHRHAMVIDSLQQHRAAKVAEVKSAISQ